MLQRQPHEKDPKLAEIADLCKRDLKFLCAQFFGWDLWDGVHDDVEYMLRKPSQRKAIVLPRDHSKSTFVTVAYSIQSILKNPNIRILIANQVWDGSRAFLYQIKTQLEQSQLKYLFGDFVSGFWNADKIVVRQRTKALKDATVATTGVESESTGGRYDLIIADDLMGEQNCQTPEQRAKVKKYRRSLVNLLEPDGVMIDCATRWHLDDPIADILEKEKRYYDIMIRSVVENGKLIYPLKFSKKFDHVTKNFIADPKGNSLDYVEYLKKTKPADEFQSQFMNNPISSENQVFKEDMFRYWNRRPDGLYTAMAVDLAVSLNKDADYTALIVCGMDKDWNIYVLDYLRGHWTQSEVINNIFDFQSRWKPHALGMEVNGFQRTYKTAVEAEQRQRKQYFGVEEIRTGPERSKESRIKSLEPFYRQGKVYHASWMKGKDIETELLTFPKGKTVDVIDAESMTLPFLSPGVGESPQAIPEGTWESAVKKVKDRDHRYGGFFHYG